MQSILEELYSGNIRPDVKFYGKDSPFVQAARLRNESFEKLTALLNESEKELFEKYSDAQADIDSITCYSNFTYGFKLGSLLMIEIFMGKGELTGNGD